jgi:phenylpropionate dioxygenase-like ring-hydroxylating dioxygenase large terminal subunit
MFSRTKARRAMTTLESREPLLRLVDADTGLIDRRIFSDRDIYELELEHIFARAWNFVAHESMIPNPGDFFMNYIGEDRVIVVRDNDGQPRVLVNSCRHRGNAVCRAEEGHATSFMCTYHGWTYDLKGSLVGVPGFKEVYHEELDRQNWGLITARVDTYNGFIFACMDEAAPDLNEYLGEVGRMSINLIASRGTLKAVGGVEKYTIPCNWKFAPTTSGTSTTPASLTHRQAWRAG